MTTGSRRVSGPASAATAGVESRPLDAGAMREIHLSPLQGSWVHWGLGDWFVRGSRTGGLRTPAIDY
jgi:hypothetical protein